MISHKVRFYLVLLVCIILIINTVRSMGDLYRGGNRVTKAQKELSELEKEQARLLREKKKVESADFIEEQARNKLGMGRLGEVTIILPEKLLNNQGVNRVAEEPNWKRWWQLVF